MANDYLTTETGDKVIDKAIGVCRATILEHRKRAIRSAVMMLVFFVFFVFLWGFFTESRMKPATEGWNLSGAAAYAGFSILFTAFCALGASLYRGHAREIVAIEHCIFDFFRTWIAARGAETAALKTEVCK